MNTFGCCWLHTHTKVCFTFQKGMLLGLCLCQGPTSIFQWWWGNVVIATTENRKEKRENLSCLKQKKWLTRRCFWRVAIVPWWPGTSCSQSASWAYPYPSVLEWRDPGLKRNGSRSARFIPEQKIDRPNGRKRERRGRERGHALAKSEARDLRFNQSGESREPSLCDETHNEKKILGGREEQLLPWVSARASNGEVRELAGNGADLYIRPVCLGFLHDAIRLPNETPIVHLISRLMCVHTRREIRPVIQFRKGHAKIMVSDKKEK